MSECSVCVDTVPQSKIIHCPKCKFESCETCIGKYIEGLNTEDITCMSCSVVWQPTFLYKNFPYRMLSGKGKVRKQREKVLFDREKAQLPAAQVQLTRTREIERRRQEIIDLTSRLKEKKQDLYRFEFQRPPKDGEVVKTEKVVCKCPKDDCRGFIMSGKHTCGLCDTHICRSCHVIKEEGHACKDSDKETIKVLKATSKPCPGCGTISIKTEGCSQVWCMICHKAWNWDSQEIETGYVHATDFYEYMRAHGLPIPSRAGAGGGVGVRDPCGRNRYAFATLYQAVIDKNNSKIDSEDFKYLYDLLNMGREFQNVRPGDVVMMAEDLRLDFLKGKIDESRWKSTLLRRDKDNIFKTEYNAMKIVFSHTIEEYCHRFVNSYRADNIEDVQEVIVEVRKFHDIIEESYLALRNDFKYKKASPFLRRVHA